MPYVNIKITREGATAQQKAELIKGVTELFSHSTLASQFLLPHRLWRKLQLQRWRKPCPLS